MTLRLLLGSLLLLCAAAAPRRALAQALQPQPIPASASYAGDGAVIVPNAAVVAPPLAGADATTAPTPDVCAARCRATRGCALFTHCPLQGGCSDGANGTVPFQQCNLLAEQCKLPQLARMNSTGLVTSGETSQPRCCGLPQAAPTRWPPPGCAAHAPLQRLAPAAGFPASPWSALYSQTFKIRELVGQALVGGDYPCEGTLESGKCVLANPADAMLGCIAAGAGCKAIVVYTRGAVRWQHLFLRADAVRVAWGSRRSPRLAASCPPHPVAPMQG